MWLDVFGCVWMCLDMVRYGSICLWICLDMVGYVYRQTHPTTYFRQPLQDSLQPTTYESELRHQPTTNLHLHQPPPTMATAAAAATTHHPPPMVW